MDSKASEIATRFQLALDLYDFSEQIVRQSLRRKHPEASEEQIETLVSEWRYARPCAELGDADGQPVPWPRRGR